MKVTSRNARADKNGRHNDRNFAIEKAEHIDKTRSTRNQYFVYNDDMMHTFQEIEYNYYDEHFSTHIEEQNKRNIESRNTKRNKTIEDYVKNKNSRPEDKILQIGDMFNHISGDKLWECALEYQRAFDAKYGDHCKIVDMALHMDEATPHVHVRRVWLAKDDYGHECVGQNKALHDMGFERPDMSKPEGRYNNAKMTFSAMDRDLFLDICKERGIEVETERRKGKEKHIPLEMFRELNPVREQLEYTKQLVEDMEESLEYTDKFLDEYTEMLLNFLARDEEYCNQIKEAKDKERLERAKILNKIYNETIASAMSRSGETASFEVVRATIDKDISNREMIRFMQREGVYDKFLEHQNSKLSKEQQHGNQQQDKEHIKSLI